MSLSHISFPLSIPPISLSSDHSHPVIMSTPLPSQALSFPSDSSLSAGKSLGEVLDSLVATQPHSFDYPAAVRVLKTCGDGAIAGLEDGKVVLVTVNPAPVSYLLECAKPHSGRVWGLDVSRAITHAGRTGCCCRYTKSITG